MLVYLDLCCLKRPFDDQRQARIALESTAVLAILQAVADGRVNAVRSLAHELENDRNPDRRSLRGKPSDPQGPQRVSSRGDDPFLRASLGADVQELCPRFPFADEIRQG